MPGPCTDPSCPAHRPGTRHAHVCITIDPDANRARSWGWPWPPTNAYAARLVAMSVDADPDNQMTGGR
jgi:hypothetical protein